MNRLLPRTHSLTPKRDEDDVVVVVVVVIVVDVDVVARLSKQRKLDYYHVHRCRALLLSAFVVVVVGFVRPSSWLS